MVPYRKETFETKIELEEMPNGTWQVRETKIFTYQKPLDALNRVENYMYDKIEESKAMK